MTEIPMTEQPSPSHGRSLWGHCCGVLSGMAQAFNGIFPCCLARENIACDVVKNLWPDPGRRQDADPE